MRKILCLSFVVVLQLWIFLSMIWPILSEAPIQFVVGAPILILCYLALIKSALDTRVDNHSGDPSIFLAGGWLVILCMVAMGCPFALRTPYGSLVISGLHF